MDFATLHNITVKEVNLDADDARTIGFEIQRLTTRKNFTGEWIKQHRRAIPIAKRLRRLFPEKCNKIIRDLYEYNRRKQEKIDAAEAGIYTIQEKEACAIGGILGHEMQKGHSAGIMMAYEIFCQIPVTFIRKLILDREEREFEDTWQIGLHVCQNKSDIAQIMAHHEKILLKALQRNLE